MPICGNDPLMMLVNMSPGCQSPTGNDAPPRRETLLYRNQTLSYTLVFRSRRTIGFAVRPDGSVHISAPAGTSLVM